MATQRRFEGSEQTTTLASAAAFAPFRACLVRTDSVRRVRKNNYARRLREGEGGYSGISTRATLTRCCSAAYDDCSAGAYISMPLLPPCAAPQSFAEDRSRMEWRIPTRYSGIFSFFPWLVPRSKNTLLFYSNFTICTETNERACSLISIFIFSLN